MKYVLYFFLFIALSYLLLWSFQRKLIYFPDVSKPQRAQFFASDMEEIALHTDDGLRLYAWYKKPTTKKVTVVYFHGNGGHLGGRMAIVRQLLDQGFGVLLVSYRGYGGNPGSPTEKGLYADARAAVAYTHNRSQCVVIYGESLGTGVAVEMAVTFPLQGLILQAPFLSLTAMARHQYPWVLIEPKDKYASNEKISRLQAPLLILHGKKDRVVPFAQGKALFDLAPGEKEMEVLPNNNHNNLWSDTFYQKVLAFLNKINNDCSN